MGLKETFLDLKDQWGKSSGGVREFLNQNQKPVIIACAVITVIALISIPLCSGGSSPVEPRSEAYYYNMATGEVFSDAWEGRNRYPPFTNRRGEEIVFAQVFTCTDCSGTVSQEPREQGPYLGYLEKFSDESLERLLAADERTMPEINERTLVSQDGEAWHSILSAEGRAIISQSCGRGAPARSCQP